MCSLCRLPVAKNHNFGQFLIFGRLLYRPPFTDEGQIWCDRADPRSTFTGQISSDCVHCVGFRWPKTTILGKFFNILGTPVPTPFYRWGPNLVCYSRFTVYAYLPNFVSIGLFSGGENPQFLPFFGLRHSVMSPIGINLRKLSTGAQLQTFPYPTASKYFLYSNVFMTKSGAQTLTFKSVTDRQTNKQTKNSTFLATLAAGGIRAPTKLGMVIENLEHVLACRKLLGVWRIVSPLGGAENLGVTRPPQLKTLITP